MYDKNSTIETQSWQHQTFMNFYFRVTIKLLLVTRWVGDKALSKENDLFTRPQKKQVGSGERGMGQKKTQRRLLAVSLFFSLTPLDAGDHSVLRYCLPI